MTNHTSLMTSLVRLKTSKNGSIGSHWFLKKIKLDTYISREVPVPKGDGAKSLHKKNLVKAKNIIADSVTDHLIPQVSSLNTSKEMFSLTKLFEGKNINRNMTLRNQLKNVKIRNAETMQLYFTRVSQIKRTN